MDTDRLPPHNLEAEAAALGCILLAEQAAPELVAMFHPADFYDLGHRRIFSLLAEMSRNSQPIDDFALRNRLKDLGQLESCGGAEYIGSLPDKTPSAANISHYRKILKDQTSRRRAIQIAAQLESLALDSRHDIASSLAEFPSVVEALTSSGAEQENWFRFYDPDYCRSFKSRKDLILVGDCHITRGEVSLISGPPGAGKSRVIAALARSGATGRPWFGLQIHSQFRTAILQNENGMARLQKDFDTDDTAELKDWIRITEPPPMGMAFDRPEFRTALKRWMATWQPGVVVFDPWNSAARDDGQRDYLALFQFIKETLPKGDDAPALIIVAHTRKPKGDERKAGRSLIHDVAGSHVLVSVPRCVFNLQPATDDPTDNRVIWTCCKNNNGELGPRSAWTRSATDFAQITDFNWEEYDRPQRAASSKPTARAVSLETLRELFEDGRRRIELATAVRELETMTGLRKTQCYEALSLKGPFFQYLTQDEEGLIGFTDRPDLNQRN